MRWADGYMPLSVSVRAKASEYQHVLHLARGENKGNINRKVLIDQQQQQQLLDNLLSKPVIKEAVEKRSV